MVGPEDQAVTGAGVTLLAVKPPLHLETHFVRWFGHVFLGAAGLGNVFSGMEKEIPKKAFFKLRRSKRSGGGGASAASRS